MSNVGLEPRISCVREREQLVWTEEGRNHIPGYDEYDFPALVDAVGDVSANGSAGDPVPLVDDQAEAVLLLQVEPSAPPLLVPHEDFRHPPSILVAEEKISKF